MSSLSIVIPTLGRQRLLARVLDRLGRQTTTGGFEVLVVADAQERDLDAVDAVVAGRPFPVRRLAAARPGASAARNAGWRAATGPIVLFLDDDVLPEPALVAEHLDWHARYPDERVGVLGRVRWADELRVTTFMRWLELGIQFDYPRIVGIDAGWGRFYTANASVKRALIERAGGFEEERLPFGYEDLDLARRMEPLGFRLLYNRAAVAEHLHEMDLDFWRRRVARIAISERAFVKLHPDVPPYFFDMFTAAATAPPARGRGLRPAPWVPGSIPWLGPKVWGSVDAFYRQALARPFLAAWHASSEGAPESQGPE